MQVEYATDLVFRPPTFGNRLRSRASLGPPARSTSIVKWRGSGQNLLKTQQIFGAALRSIWVAGTPGHRAMILRSEISWTREP